MFCEHLFEKRYHTEMLALGASPALRHRPCVPDPPFRDRSQPDTLCRKPKPPRKTNCWNR
ncbi:hypothetical protein CBM2587_A170082 [Cupriavidus taiwanensis]|uniref:Uncharacterized protein n=1 Tax=Cupriavidus taiwanensis TaxID=164546 RepID=A0A975ZZZ3_9BURK|nr:hypothetical protein CBM2587_A170082 [Cupriavidus taiwanensis]